MSCIHVKKYIQKEPIPWLNYTFALPTSIKDKDTLVTINRGMILCSDLVLNAATIVNENGGYTNKRRIYRLEKI